MGSAGTDATRPALYSRVIATIRAATSWAVAVVRALVACGMASVHETRDAITAGANSTDQALHRIGHYARRAVLAVPAVGVCSAVTAQHTRVRGEVGAAAATNTRPLCTICVCLTVVVGALRLTRVAVRETAPIFACRAVRVAPTVDAREIHAGGRVDRSEAAAPARARLRDRPVLLGYRSAPAGAASRAGTGTGTGTGLGVRRRRIRGVARTCARHGLVGLTSTGSAEKQAEREGGGPSIDGCSLQRGPPFCALPEHVAPLVWVGENVPLLLKKVAMPRLIVVPENNTGTTELVTFSVWFAVSGAPCTLA